jgi:hypothetical protein
MQDTLCRTVKLLEGDLHDSTNKGERARLATAIGGIGRSWAGLEERIRILKGQPLPGSLTHEKVKRTRLPRSLSASVLELGPVEPLAQ